MSDRLQQDDSTAADDGNELRGLVAVVTGSSSGIGRAIALEFARAGADVCVHARRHAEAAAEVADEIRALGCHAHVCLADLADPATHETLVDEAWRWSTDMVSRGKAVGGVQVWVNNAGVDVLTGPAAQWSFEEKLARLWAVDVAATMRLSRIIGGRMRGVKASHPGSHNYSILNMGWDQAQTGMAGDSGEMFAAIKGAVMAFSKSLAHSLAPEIRVNCLAPGWIKTSWGDHASAYWGRRATGESLLARWGTPEDVARVARFLASPAAAFVTGQIMPVNGGFRGSHLEPHQS